MRNGPGVTHEGREPYKASLCSITDMACCAAAWLMLAVKSTQRFCVPQVHKLMQLHLRGSSHAKRVPAGPA